MKLQVRHAGGELEVQSHKELLQLYRRGVIAGDDEVLRGGEWVRVADLPWIHSMNQDTRSDNRRLFWLTLALMVLGLAGVFWVQRHADAVARKTGIVERTPAAVHVVPR